MENEIVRQCKYVRSTGWLAALLLLAACFAGCGAGGGQGGSVVVYSALDREFAEPILTNYGVQTGVDVHTKFDVESTKTVGLFNLILAESAAPRCDLFWNNEILNTIRLEEKGLLVPFHPNLVGALGDQFKSPSGLWYGFAARARILLVNTELLKEAERPTSIKDLIDPKFRGKIGIAKPLFGTTATHAACLFAAWGADEAKNYYKSLKANGVHVYSGNKQVALAVGSGEIAFGITDTDDAMGEVDAGRPVKIVYPDRAQDQLGTLFLPNTIAIMKGASHLQEAQALASYLLSPEIENLLANGPGAQIPLIPADKVVARVETASTVHAMDVDFSTAAQSWDEAMKFLAVEFAE